MKRFGLLHRGLALFTLFTVLTLFSFMGMPGEAQAFPELSKDGTCTECHEPGQHGTEEPAKQTEPEKPGEPAKPAEPAEPAQPIQTAGPIEPAKPSESHERKVNNPLLAVGLVAAVIIIGGKLWMDKHKS